MVSRKTIDDFLAQKKVAVVGVSRTGKGFGCLIYRELKSKGYQVYAVNPQASVIDGDPCYPSLKLLPEAVGGAVFVIPPAETEKAVQVVAEVGIPRVWMQQGSESHHAIQFCRDHGISVVYGECMLMFAEPAAIFHRIHRCVKRLIGKLPPPA